MKILLLLSIAVAYVHGQGVECRCGGFVLTHDGEEEVLPLPPHQLDDCTQNAECAEFCLAEWDEATNGGDLCTDTGSGTIADDMCQYLYSIGVNHLQPTEVYLYYNVCDGPWQWDSAASQQMLECKSNSSLVDCFGPGTISTMLYY